jgi:hypothetical protein
MRKNPSRPPAQIRLAGRTRTRSRAGRRDVPAVSTSTSSSPRPRRSGLQVLLIEHAYFADAPPSRRRHTRAVDPRIGEKR